jgi:hypothetical protein
MSDEERTTEPDTGDRVPPENGEAEASVSETQEPSFDALERGLFIAIEGPPVSYLTDLVRLTRTLAEEEFEGEQVTVAMSCPGSLPEEHISRIIWDGIQSNAHQLDAATILLASTLVRYHMTQMSEGIMSVTKGQHAICVGWNLTPNAVYAPNDDGYWSMDAQAKIAYRIPDPDIIIVVTPTFLEYRRAVQDLQMNEVHWNSWFPKDMMTSQFETTMNALKTMVDSAPDFYPLIHLDETTANDLEGILRPAWVGAWDKRKQMEHAGKI